MGGIEAPIERTRDASKPSMASRAAGPSRSRENIKYPQGASRGLWGNLAGGLLPALKPTVTVLSICAFTREGAEPRQNIDELRPNRVCGFFNRMLAEMGEAGPKRAKGQVHNAHPDGRLRPALVQRPLADVDLRGSFYTWRLRTSATETPFTDSGVMEQSCGRTPWL